MIRQGFLRMRPEGEEEMSMTVKSYSLYTTQIDDADAAAEEIRRQLDEISLLANSVGILTCHYDYLAGGGVAVVAKMLPFPVVGYTTFYQAVPQHNGLFELCVTVLTSDSVRFGTAFASADSGQSPYDIIADAYGEACRDENDPPSLLMGFVSAARPISGDAFLRILDETTGGIPCFGAVAISDQDDGQDTYVLAGARQTEVGFVLLAFFGEVDSHFYYGSFTEEMMLSVTATVTDSEGAVVKKLNKLDAVTFLEKSGLEINAESRSGLVTIPFLHRRPDEEAAVARTMVDFTDEGHAVFFGEIPENSSLRIGYATPDDLLRVTAATAQEAIAESGERAIYFMFSCVGRYLTLGLDSEVELRRATQGLPADASFLATYVGGEICPVHVGGQLLNRYHNSSFVICALR